MAPYWETELRRSGQTVECGSDIGQATVMTSRHLDRCVRTLLLCAGVFAGSALQGAAQAAEPLHNDWYKCDDTARRVEKQTGMPKLLLSAVSLTETGRPTPDRRRARSWPWTVWAAGQSMHFETKEAAIRAVKRLLRQGIRSIDVGCMQVNLKYHPHAFTSVEEAFDPPVNMNYAASFLSRLKRRHGDWESAIRYYHSGTTRLNTKYHSKAIRLWGVLKRRNAKWQKASGISQQKQGPENKLAFATGHLAAAPDFETRVARSDWTIMDPAAQILAQHRTRQRLAQQLTPLKAPSGEVHSRVVLEVDLRPKLSDHRKILASNEKSDLGKPPQNEAEGGAMPSASEEAAEDTAQFPVSGLIFAANGQ